MGIITAVTTTTGIVDEAHLLEALIDQHQQLTQQKVRSHMGDLRNTRQEGMYPASRFANDARRDVYTCPAGSLLRRHHFIALRGYFEYPM